MNETTRDADHAARIARSHAEDTAEAVAQLASGLISEDMVALASAAMGQRRFRGADVDDLPNWPEFLATMDAVLAAAEEPAPGQGR